MFQGQSTTTNISFAANDEEHEIDVNVADDNGRYWAQEAVDDHGICGVFIKKRDKCTNEDSLLLKRTEITIKNCSEELTGIFISGSIQVINIIKLVSHRPKVILKNQVKSSLRDDTNNYFQPHQINVSVSVNTRDRKRDHKQLTKLF